MNYSDLKNKKTVMIKPKGLINYRKMQVTKTSDGFTISNYGGQKIAGHEFLFYVDNQEKLDLLDVLE